MDNTINPFAAWFAALSPAERIQAGAAFRALTGGTLSAYANPRPVVVALVPVSTDQGLRLLGVRRTIAPRAGTIVLPGGFMEEGEEVEAAVAREVREETCLDTAPGAYVQFGRACATERGELLLFMRHQATLSRDEVQSLQGRLQAEGDGEASELVLIAPDTELGFPLHQAAATGFFRQA